MHNNIRITLFNFLIIYIMYKNIELDKSEIFFNIKKIKVKYKIFNM